ncbi:MAG: hypothetical protein QOE44_1344, partial [Solirubrobacteraceae bacterium]|nr:hypothetical protein [Solirubrobacteraceae bacterium]
MLSGPGKIFFPAQTQYGIGWARGRGAGRDGQAGGSWANAERA